MEQKGLYGLSQKMISCSYSQPMYLFYALVVVQWNGCFPSYDDLLSFNNAFEIRSEATFSNISLLIPFINCALFGFFISSYSI